jgi:phosphoenolpyruvate synthase/pyruvate phosphate dikinase
MVCNASFGLGEAVVSGQVTPDTYIIDKKARAVTQTVLGPKEQKIVSMPPSAAAGEKQEEEGQGVVLEDVGEAERGVSSLTPEMLEELIGAACRIEALYDGLPQDIEWAFINQGQGGQGGSVLHLLQSRPITLLPASLTQHDGIEQLDWTPDPPARYLTRRQIVENMPDPISPRECMSYSVISPKLI